MFDKLNRMFGRSTRSRRSQAGDGRRVYAIGDIHGCTDLLNDLHRRIRSDAALHPDREKIVVYLGDYIDRGPDSKGVIDCLIDRPLADFQSVHLLGNHEDFMMRFLADHSIGPLWIANGGDATLISYGAASDSASVDRDRLPYLQRRLLDYMPQRHLRFLRGLRNYHIERDYVFVHAGLRPGMEIERQDANDLMWIRDEFLNSKRDHGHIVVHGHSINTNVEFRDNRIGVDTGAYSTGRLTCLVLEGTERTLIQTGTGATG